MKIVVLIIFLFLVLLWRIFFVNRIYSLKDGILWSIYLIVIGVLATLFLWRNMGRRIYNIPALLIPYLGDNMINTLLAMLGIGSTFLFIWCIHYLVSQGYILKKKKIKYHNRFLFILSTILVFLGIILYLSSSWAMSTFNNVSFDQMMYLFSQPLTGTDPRQIIQYLVNPLLTSTFISCFFSTFLYVITVYQVNYKIKKKRHRWDSSFTVAFIISFIAFSLGIVLSVIEVGYADIKAYYFDDSKLYNEFYVDPTTTAYRFPEKKRNLIYIFLESLESSYTSKEFGGIKEDNLIPNLTNLALDKGVHFSNGEFLGGMLPIPGGSHTASAMVAQTAGIPLKTSGNTSLHVNNYGKYGEEFLPGAHSIGEILQKEGYNQVLFFGSDAAFAGRDKYFSQHGDYEIRDYKWAKEKELIPDDYKVWWGYEDEKLFEFAKESLTELSSQQQPFNFTFLTADTHFEDGYLDANAPNLFDDQYSNVINYSDSQIMSFVEWVEAQPFYENTSVILVGDHLTMDKDFMKNIPETYQRTIYNLFLNSGEESGVRTNRLFSSLDMLPTTLATLGVEIPNNRLGLGVNLFSNDETLIESIGYDSFYAELMKRSTFYERKFMQGTDLKQILEKQAK